MIVNNQLQQQYNATKYLNTSNSSYYRPIIRLLLEKYEIGQGWLSSIDIHSSLAAFPQFRHYNLNDCIDHLKQLVKWQTLKVEHNNQLSGTIEEFINEKNRYKLDDVVVYVEKGIREAEKSNRTIKDMGTYLATNIEDLLYEFNEIKDNSGKDLKDWWRNLEDNFDRLNESVVAYINDINKPNMIEFFRKKDEENKLNTFFEKFQDFLLEVIFDLQDKSQKIRSLLNQITSDDIENILIKITDYYQEKGIIEEEQEIEEFIALKKQKFIGLTKWFIESDGKTSEVYHYMKKLENIIRRMVESVNRIRNKNNLVSGNELFFNDLAKSFYNSDLDKIKKMANLIFNNQQLIHYTDLHYQESSELDANVKKFNTKEIEVPTRKKINRNFSANNKKGSLTADPKIKVELEKNKKEKLIKEKNIEKFLINKEEFYLSELKYLNYKYFNKLMSWVEKGLQNDFNSKESKEIKTLIKGTTYKLIYCNTDTEMIKIEKRKGSKIIGTIEIADYKIKFNQKGEKNESN